MTTLAIIAAALVGLICGIGLSVWWFVGKPIKNEPTRISGSPGERLQIRGGTYEIDEISYTADARMSRVSLSLVRIDSPFTRTRLADRKPDRLK